MNIIFPRVLLLEKSSKKNHQDSLYKNLDGYLYNNLRLSTNSEMSTTVKSRIYNFNRQLKISLRKCYNSWQFQLCAEKYAKERNHVKYKVPNYKVYIKNSKKNISNIDVIYQWKGNFHEKYDFIEIFERIDFYGNVKKVALINDGDKDFDYQYETTMFYTKKEIEQKYLDEIKKKELEIENLKKNYNNFI